MHDERASVVEDDGEGRVVEDGCRHAAGVGDEVSDEEFHFENARVSAKPSGVGVGVIAL